MLVEKALEKEPADRYQTMRDLVVDLRRTTRRSDSPSVARRFRPALAAGVLGVLIVALAVLLVTRWRETPAEPRVVQFTIDPPAGHSFTTGTRGLAAS